MKKYRPTTPITNKASVTPGFIFSAKGKGIKGKISNPASMAKIIFTDTFKMMIPSCCSVNKFRLPSVSNCFENNILATASKTKIESRIKNTHEFSVTVRNAGSN
ncbi:MAG: hypothetical protein Q4G27_08765 [Flavobacteriaceae bacterium]|nr:hypothetical protein [Flavobacteriaceae bacterium]